MPSLNFKGRALVQNFHLLVPFHELKPVKVKSETVKPSLHENLVVHGDNLKALKALVALPGWFVDWKVPDPEVPVLSGKQIRKWVEGLPNVAPEKMVEQVAYQLDRRCRDVEF